MEKVLVLLSTYNGEKFIQEQLNSIGNLMDCTISILIRDDGSSDKTIEIIENWKNSTNIPTEIISGSNIGWKRSFFKLIEIAHRDYGNFDYYAFADQDDIWLPNKISEGIKKLQSYNSVPCLYCSNLLYYKDNKNYGLIVKTEPQITPFSALVRNYATGCTIIFNKQFLTLINKEFPKIEIAHDYWCYLVALTCGKLVYDMDSHILYRQHENNQIGYRTGWKEKWKRRLNQFKSSVTSHIRENQAKELGRIFLHEMNDDGREAVSKMANYRASFRNRCSLLLDDRYTTNVPSSDRWLKLRIIFNCL